MKKKYESDDYESDDEGPSEEEIKEAVDRRIEDLKWEEKSWAGANGMEYHDSPSLQDNAHYGAMIDMQNHELGGKR